MASSLRQSDTCCYFLNLRLGAVIIGIINSVFFIFLFSWYLCSDEFLDRAYNMLISDVIIFITLCLLIIVNTLLIVGSVQKLPSHLIPWLSVTGSLIMIALLVLLASLMFGREFVADVKKTQYLTILIVLAVAISLDTFFWIAVFVLWRNILEESPAQVDVIERSKGMSGTSFSSPPCYIDLEHGGGVGSEDPPPDYEAVIGQMMRSLERDVETN